MLKDHKSIKIEDSQSKLSFTTTGGVNWDVWDIFISYNNEQLFHIGNICGTCAFFYRQLKTDIKTSITAETVRDQLNTGLHLLEKDIIDNLSPLFPTGEYEVFLFEINPYQTRHNTKRDYFTEEQEILWNYGDEDSEKAKKPGMAYYRGNDGQISETGKLFELFIPLYQPEDLNEEKIRYYQEEIRAGKKPTALSLSLIDIKESMIYEEEPEDGIVCHWYLANYLLDGHHKIEAASREGKPITLISFIAKDRSYKVMDKIVNYYNKM